jgi:two-component system phosphate regulon response regulator PhoB
MVMAPASEPTRLLIVEDEPDLASTLAYNFEREGFTTTTAGTVALALAELERGPPDLIVLDVMLPDLSGFEVCRRVRATPTLKHVPILMLTARGEEIDRVVGFEVGADDYVVKPFSVRELVLRVRALLRRAHPQTEVEAHPTKRRFGLLEIDDDGHRAFVAGQEVTLTALDLKLLKTLLDRKGRVQTRETLLNDVWGLDKDVSERTVDTSVKRLREKLGAAGAYVETLRGVGYRLIAQPPQASAPDPPEKV